VFARSGVEPGARLCQMVPNVFLPAVAVAAHKGISPRDEQDWRAGSGNGPGPSATAFAALIPFVALVPSVVEPHAWCEGLRLTRFHSIVKSVSPETASNDAAKRRSAQLRTCRQRRPDRRADEDLSREDEVAAGFAIVKPESETEEPKVGPGRRPTRGPRRAARNRRRGAWLVGSIRGRHAHR